MLNDLAGSGDVYLGSKFYGRLMTGTHTLFCISNNGAQSELLAGELIKDLNMYGLVIANVLNLVKFFIDKNLINGIRIKSSTLLWENSARKHLKILKNNCLSLTTR